jgi:hypothetical protein
MDYYTAQALTVCIAGTFLLFALIVAAYMSTRR